MNAALAAEGRKLDKKHCGSHRFAPIWQAEGRGSNWFTSPQTIASSIDFDEMHEAIERVRAKMPLVNFGW